MALIRTVVTRADGSRVAEMMGMPFRGDEAERPGVGAGFALPAQLERQLSVIILAPSTVGTRRMALSAARASIRLEPPQELLRVTVAAVTEARMPRIIRST